MSDWKFGEYNTGALYIRYENEFRFAIGFNYNDELVIALKSDKATEISKLFLDVCSPTKSELTLFNLEFGIDFPEKELYNEFLSRNNLI